MQLKRGLNVAIMRNALTRNLATKGGKCDDTHQHCSNTKRCFRPRKLVASKQPTCVESKREVNKVNKRLTETVIGGRRGDRHHSSITHRPSTIPRYKSRTLRPPEALRTPLMASVEWGGRLSRPARPRHGRSAAAARRRPGSLSPHPRRSRCHS